MMAAEAVFLKDPDVVQITAPAALVNGQVIQTPDGRAGLFAGAGAGAASGDLVSIQVAGQARLAKTTSMIVLNGQELWWDISTNKVTHSSVNGDFRVGVAVAAEAAAATTVDVDLNVPLRPRISFNGTSWDVTETLGLGVKDVGGMPRLEADNTSEAATAALFSATAVPIAALPIFEGVLNIGDNGAAAADFNFGIANESHATDFDSVGESCVFHFNGTDLKIYAESDDGTTEVGATDTTVVYVVGTRFFLQIDCTNLADIQMYVNGVNVLPATVFKLDAASGPMLSIAHFEKTSDTSTYKVDIESMTIRTAIDT